MIHFRSIALRWAYPCVCRADPYRWSRRQYEIDLSPWIRGGFALWCEECRSDRLIPVRTERIRQYLLQNHPGMVHPRIHGADLIRQWVKCRNQGFIPVHTGQILNSLRKFLRLRSSCSRLKIPWQNQYVSSFWNAFCGWHFLVIFYYFRKRCRRHLFLILFPYHDILFCLHSSRVLHLTNALSFPVQ